MTTDNRPVPFSLRIEPTMREKIENLARANSRSVNSQIVWMLDAYLDSGLPSFEEIDEPTKEEFKKIAREVFEEEVRQMVKEKLAKANQ